MKTTRTTIAALCAGLLAACGGGSSPTAPPPPPAPPPPAAAGLAFTVQPGNTVAGAPISPAIVVEVRDSAGSVVTSSVSNVTLTLGANPGGGPLSGTRTVRAQAGIATFTDISVQVAASGYSLTATASGLASATSATFDVAPAAPRAISIEAQPGDGATGLVLAPAVDVAVRDTFGNLVPGATNAITVALGANPTGASLSGTTTVSASGGRASFTDLVLDRAGRGFTLSFSAAGLTGATSGPFDVLLGFSTIEAGFRHTCGVAVGGTAYCWGSNSFGELGDNSGVTDRKKPAAVVGGIAFASVVAGSFHTCGLDASGTAYCWGLNTDGQLGDGTNTDRAVPTLVAGGHTFTRLAAGGHTCGLDTSGTAFCWGGNASGQLGDGIATP
ncbi:MAG: hypothetical protein ACE5HF_10510, partial [Gemmatimonadota bacterium]